MENITRQFICNKFHPFDLALIPAPEHDNFCPNLADFAECPRSAKFSTRGKKGSVK